MHDNQTAACVCVCVCVPILLLVVLIKGDDQTGTAAPLTKTSGRLLLEC